MAGKNRKHHLPTEDTQEVLSEGGVEGKSAMEVFMLNQARRDEEMEERRERAAIAAEEREESRRAKAKLLEAELAEKAKIAEEERAYQRELQKEARKLEETKRKEEVVRNEAERQEELLRRSEELTKQAAVKAAELQEEATQRALEQQKELLELQAELGRKASEATRVESQRVRQKDRAVASVTAWQKGEDLEDFLLSSERKLRAGGIPEEEWLGVLASKKGDRRSSAVRHY